MSFRALLCSALLLMTSSVTALATPLQVTVNGTFSSNTPVTAYSAPSGSFGFSFLVDSNPAVASSQYLGVTRISAITDVVYTLNGAATYPTASFNFYNANAGGGLAFCFTTNCNTAPIDFYFSGQQMYTGSESAPSLLAGSFANTFGEFEQIGKQGFYDNYVLASYTNTNIAGITPTPEPSSLALLGTGLIGAFGVVRRRLAR